MGNKTRGKTLATPGATQNVRALQKALGPGTMSLLSATASPDRMVSNTAQATFNRMSAPERSEVKLLLSRGMLRRVVRSTLVESYHSGRPATEVRKKISIPAGVIEFPVTIK